MLTHLSTRILVSAWPSPSQTPCCLLTAQDPGSFSLTTRLLDYWSLLLRMSFFWLTNVLGPCRSLFPASRVHAGPALCVVFAPKDTKEYLQDNLTRLKDAEDKIPSLATHPRTHRETTPYTSIYIYIYTWMHIIVPYPQRINIDYIDLLDAKKDVSTGRNIHALFHEQEVCRRGLKKCKKAHLMRKTKIATPLHRYMSGSGIRLYCSKNRGKRDREWVSDCNMILHKAPNRLTHSLREIIIYCLPTTTSYGIHCYIPISLQSYLL